MPYSQNAQTWITQFYVQITPCLRFLHKRWPEGTTPNWGGRYPIAAYYLPTPNGWKAELAWFVDYSRQFTQISGHPSGTGRAQDSEVRRPKTDVLPLCHATNVTYCSNDLSGGFILWSESVWYLNLWQQRKTQTRT